MRDKDERSASGDYEVGYGKPPKHTQFLPGQSGFKGRRRKKNQTIAEILSKIVQEEVLVGGKSMSMLAVAIRQTFTQTIKSGKARDLQNLLQLCAQYNVLPVIDEGAKSKAAADAVVKKIFDTFDRLHDIDPEDSAASQRDADAEAMLVISCPHCGPELKECWKQPEYLARAARYENTKLHDQVLAARVRKGSKTAPK